MECPEFLMMFIFMITKAGSERETRPCVGCKYCTSQSMLTVKEDVDNVVPLAVKTVTESSSNNIWLEGYSKHSIKHSIQMDVYRKLSLGLLQRSGQNKKSLH